MPGSTHKSEILSLYEKIKKSFAKDFYVEANVTLLDSIYIKSLEYLDGCGRMDLISKVPGKSYFAFIDEDGKTSRAINKDLFFAAPNALKQFTALLDSGELKESDRDFIEKTLYSVSIAFCAAIDLLKKGDQKTPGTFFEYFIAFYFSWRVGANPKRKLQVLNIDDLNTSLPTDFIFNLGPDKQKFHMPIKTSTRERAIMLWAHQKLIDGIYGNGTFMGTAVLLAETKTDKKKKEVIEIYTPDQWKLYQMYISKLTRVYYLDLPKPYEKLNSGFPPIRVRKFVDFFYEWNTLAPS